jgi:hypothetical protein
MIGSQNLWEMMPLWGNYLLVYGLVAMLGLPVNLVTHGKYPKLWPLITYAWPVGVLLLLIYMVIWVVRAIVSVIK